MKLLFGIFFICQLLVMEITKAEEPHEVAQGDWTGAAKFAMSKIRYYSGTILVVDSTVPETAVIALRSIWPVISIEELPQRDEYIIPPGPYMVIRKFEERDGIFKFSETMGSIKKGTMGHCGTTEIVTMRRKSDGIWELAQPMELIDC